MLDYIHKTSEHPKYFNCHSLGIIDHQAMKIRHGSLKDLLEAITYELKEGKIRDTDILYLVPTGKEYNTVDLHRIKNDKFTGSINNGEEVVSKKGSIIPLIGWIEDNLATGKEKVYIGRYTGGVFNE